MTRGTPPPSGKPGQRILLAAGLAVVVAYLAGTLWYSRFHMLDDALIHLRLAELFLQHGFFTTDGSAHDFGTSSPVFVLLAAAVHGLVETDFTTKFLSIVFYVALIGGPLALALRAADLARAGWIALTVLVISPMGVRWLTDGMETSLVAGLALLLGAAAAAGGRSGPAQAAALAALGAVAVTTRIELTLLVALASLCIAVRLRPGAAGGETRVLMALPVALGGGAGLLAIWLCFGALLPDAAIAKAAGGVAPADSLLAIAISLAGGLLFGAGLFALWLVSLWANLAFGRARLAAVIVPNLALLVLWAAIAARGQYVQGIRHVLPALMFMIAANISFLAAAPLPSVSRRVWNRRAAWAAACAVTATFMLEFLKFQPIVENRTAAFLNMRMLHLEALEGRSGIGWDVGHLMYFTKGNICDVNGLINGRAAAAAPDSARLDSCLKREVEFVFVTPENAAELIDRSGARFADWPVCGRYLFQNVSATAPHYLAVSPARAQQVCPQRRAPDPLKRAALSPS
jgi:hypothetical protein